MTANATARIVVGKTISGLAIIHRPNGGLQIGKAVIGPKCADRWYRDYATKAVRTDLDGLECVSCKAPHAVFTTGCRRAGPELAIITYACAACGVKDIDYLD
jgi:hypothetical protein